MSYHEEYKDDPVYQLAFGQLRAAVCRMEDHLLAINSAVKASYDAATLNPDDTLGLRDGWIRVLTFRTHEYHVSKKDYAKATNAMRRAIGEEETHDTWGT